jgi:hypothetical protein
MIVKGQRLLAELFDLGVPATASLGRNADERGAGHSDFLWAMAGTQQLFVGNDCHALQFAKLFASQSAGLVVVIDDFSCRHP